MKRWILALSVMCCVSVADAEDVDTAVARDAKLALEKAFRPVLGL